MQTFNVNWLIKKILLLGLLLSLVFFLFPGEDAKAATLEELKKYTQDYINKQSPVSCLGRSLFNCQKSAAILYYSDVAKKTVDANQNLKTPAEKKASYDQFYVGYNRAVDRCRNDNADAVVVLKCLSGVYDNEYAKVLSSAKNSTEIINARDTALQTGNRGGQPSTDSLCSWGTTWFKFGLSGCLSGIIYIFSVGLTAPLAYLAPKLF